MKNRFRVKDRKRALMLMIFLAAVFLFLLCWAVIQPFNASPDEEMRYQIVQYIVKHGALPDGRDPEILNATWGISYAFYPILAYMIMAIPAKIVSLFTSSAMAMVIAARLVNVVFGTVMAYLTYKIGEMVFQNRAAKWMFTCLVTFLPGLLFVHSYVNNDSMALLSVTWIIYVWVRSVKEGWSWKICVHLAAAVSMCALSYYNAYGYILCSLIFFVISILFSQQKEHRLKFLFSRGAVIVGIVAVLAGWWFIRNAVLYNGDFLGMQASNICAEQFAAEGFRPSERISLKDQGLRIYDMFRLQPGEWPHNWIVTVAVSFVGTFGYLNIFMPYSLTKIYFLVFGIGLFGCLFAIRKLFFLRGTKVEKTRETENGEAVIHKKIYLESRWNKQNVMHLCMLLAIAITFGLLVQYSYASDLQAQGRYILPMIIPFMYFITYGYQTLLNRFIKKEWIQKFCYGVVMLFCIAGAIYTYAAVFAPNYV